MILGRNIRIDSALAVIIIFTFIIFIGFFRLAYPYLDHWANFCDADSLIAARNFVKFGFIKCYFLPIFDPQVTKPGAFYLHYPLLPQVFYGFLLKLLGFSSNPLFILLIFRIITLLFSGLACWFWYLFLRNLTFSSFISLTGLLFYITNPVFVLNADAINPYSHMEVFRTSIILLFITFIIKRKNKSIFILLLSLLFLNILNSFEYVVYIFLFMLLYLLFFKKRLGFRYWLAMFIAVSLGFMLHFLQNALMFGSFRQAFFDLFNSAIQRIRSSSELGYIAPNFKFWFYYCFVRNLRFVSFNIFKLVTILVFLVIFLIKRSSVDKRAASILCGLKLILILFLCGLSWWILFPSHSIIHIYPATHMLLAVSLLEALIFYFLIYFNKQGLFKINRIIFNITISALILLLVMHNLLKSDLPITQRNKLSKGLFLNYTKILSQMGSELEKDEYILSNYWNVQVMEYYSDRNCLYITTLEELEKQNIKHKYFLYFGGSEELFHYLKNNYNPIGEYVAQNIPSNTMMRFIIFKKA